MCRSIKVLNRPGETATGDEVTGAALQFVRKISGYRKPSRANQEAFERAVQEISQASDHLLRAVGRTAPVRRKPTVPSSAASQTTTSDASPGESPQQVDPLT